MTLFGAHAAFIEVNWSVMNLVYGQVVEILDEDEMRTARVRVAGAIRQVPLELLADVQCGDKVLICDGVAIGRVSDDVSAEQDYVSGDSG